MRAEKFKRLALKSAKVLGWIIASIVFLFIVLILALRIPAVQQYITTEAVKFFKEKVDTNASIGRLYVNFPSTIVVEDLYVEDQKGDTLIYCKYLGVDTDLWGLLDNRLILNQVEADKLISNIYNSEKDTTFNYQFIVEGFTPSQPAPIDTSTQSKPFHFAIYGAVISNSSVRYDDWSAGLLLHARLGELDVSLNQFDLENSIFSINEIILKNSQGKLTVLKSSTDTDTTSGEMVDVSGRALLVENVQFTFEDKPGRMKVFTDAGHLEAELDEIDVINQSYKGQRVIIANSFVSIDQFSQEGDSVAVLEDTTSQNAIKLLAELREGSIQNTSFRYYDHNYPAVDGFDPNHIWFQKLNTSLKNVQFKDGFTEGEILELSVTERGGLLIDNLTASLSYGVDQSYINDLHLVTRKSEIAGGLKINYPSLEALTTNPKDVKVMASFDRSRLALEDVYYFQPGLRKEFDILPVGADNIIFKGNIEGTLANLTIRQLQAEALKSTEIDVTGTIKGLPDIKNTRFDISLDKFKTSRRDIKLVLPDTLLPSNLELPDQFSLSGSFQGFLTNFKSKLVLKSTAGDMKADMAMQEKAPDLYAYQGQLHLQQLQVGYLLKQPDMMGPLSLKVEINGAGFTLEDLNTSVKGAVSSFLYNGYEYQDLEINGQFRSMEFNGQLSMDDPHLDFGFNGLLSMHDSIPQYQFQLDLRSLDLQALNFTEEDLKIRTKVISDITASSIKNINGTLEIEDFVMAKAGKVYRLDTFLLSSSMEPDMTDITIFSKVIDANFKGNFDLVTLPEVLQKHFNRYYSLQDVPDVEQLELQQFEFDVNIKRPYFFTEMLIPQLKELQPGPIRGSYNSQLWELDIDVVVPAISYANFSADSIKLNIRSDEDELNYQVNVARFASGGMAVDNIDVGGLVEADHIKADFRIKDNEDKSKYHFGGIFISGDDYYRFQFTPGEFVLNYDPWQVKPGNRIDFHPSGIWITDMVLTNNDQKITLHTSVNNQGDSLLNAQINNFDLSFLGKLEEKEIYTVGGILNGKIDVSLESEKAAFTSNLHIDKFSFKGDTLGDITLFAENSGGNKYMLDMDVQSRNNNLKIDGYYLADSVPVLNMNANLVRLDLSTIESFTMGQLNEMNGIMTGNLKLTGTLADPNINGRLKFNEASFRVKYLQSKLNINDQSLVFNKTGIAFNNFVVEDIHGNEARINGNMSTKDYSTYQFDLSVNANNFQMLNTTAKDNPLFYGNLAVNSTARITGTSERPDVQLEVSLAEGSALTYVIPETEIQIQEREGVIEFFDKDLESDPFLEELEVSQTTDTLAAALKGLSLTAIIDVNRNSTLNVVIDPVTGDKLAVQGDANLTLGIKPSGDMTLTGRYEVYNGIYNLNFYGLVKREFNIRRGSYLIWTGDPLNARMDITATYAVSAVYDVPGQDDISGQKAPFIVYLDIQNELLNPDISFRLGLEEGANPPGAQMFVSTVSRSENELNAQVFYLLLFKSTKDLESFSTTGGGGNIAEATARSSASRLLSNQLNKLAGRIEGVELSLDLESYNTAGGNGATTQLELGLSKQLFNNRVVVKVAGNFGLEGEQAEQQKSLSDFAGDIRIEYKLTKDGRFRLVGFRENEYDNLLLGEVIKTGAGVIFVRDYDSFKELFKIKKDEPKE